MINRIKLEFKNLITLNLDKLSSVTVVIIAILLVLFAIAPLSGAINKDSEKAEAHRMEQLTTFDESAPIGTQITKIHNGYYYTKEYAGKNVDSIIINKLTVAAQKSGYKIINITQSDGFLTHKSIVIIFEKVK